MIIHIICEIIPQLAAMYVCICNAVTDKQIRRAVADGCHTMRSLRQELEVASCCGKCAPQAHQLLKQTLLEMDAAPQRRLIPIFSAA